MARNWYAVTVELLGGRGAELWPRPGRILAVGPSHTFQDLADAINAAFARWDRAHLSLFTLADGRIVTDEETGAEFVASTGGPITEALDITTTKVGQTLEPGAEVKFTFDLGDDWVHRCVVGDETIDPLETLGIRPKTPLPYWGWGTIPDQYGREWHGDDGSDRAPERPSQPHPMLRGWPTDEQVVELDLDEFRAAAATNDGPRLLAAVSGRDVDEVLQQVGAVLPIALEQVRDTAEDVMLSVLNRLTMRAEAGDAVLAEDLLARLRGEPLSGQVLPIDLDHLTDLLEGDPSWSSGGYVDLHTGAVYGEHDTDPGMVGDDAAIDVEEEPDRWLWFDSAGSRDGWQDMADFAERQRDASLRERMERAIHGKGAFRRFGDLVFDEGLGQRWLAFKTDRQWGRAREMLASQGVRIG